MPPTPTAFPRALSPLIPTRALPGIYTALGPKLLPSWFLWALEPTLKSGEQIFWLDAGNSFDAYGASYAAKSMGWDPKEILKRIQLARPFNLFQLETMVAKKIPAKWHGEPVIISDPFPLFYEEDVPAPEAQKIFNNVLKAMQAFPALWLVLAVERQAPEGREQWLPQLLKHSNAVANLAGPEHLHLEKR
jgi:hypothetical protein